MKRLVLITLMSMLPAAALAQQNAPDAAAIAGDAARQLMQRLMVETNNAVAAQAQLDVARQQLAAKQRRIDDLETWIRDYFGVATKK